MFAKRYRVIRFDPLTENVVAEEGKYEGVIPFAYHAPLGQRRVPNQRQCSDGGTGNHAQSL